MKYKIIDQEAIYLAGVIHYGTLEKSDFNDKNRGKHVHFDFEQDEDFQKNVEDLKQNALKLKEQIKEEVKFHTDHFNNDYKEHRKQWKEETKENVRKAKDMAQEARHHDSGHTSGDEKYDDNPYMTNFEGAISKFGNVMESLGKHIEKNAHNWEANIKDWSANLEKNMEGFGEKMDSWGENFGKRMEEWGESFGEQWDHDFDVNTTTSDIRSYPLYRSYEEIYKKHLQDHPDHIKRQTFYEVQIMDTSDDHLTSMVMIGGRMARLDDVRYPVATMTFQPHKWVTVKLTSEEFAKDWLGSLEKVDQLKGYRFEPYFIVRHKLENAQDDIRLFCPISEKRNEG